MKKDNILLSNLLKSLSQENDDFISECESTLLSLLEDCTELRDKATELYDSWSGSWFESKSNLYLEDFSKASPYERKLICNYPRGVVPGSKRWMPFDYDDVVKHTEKSGTKSLVDISKNVNTILKRSQVLNLKLITELRNF